MRFKWLLGLALCLMAARPAFACIDIAQTVDTDILYADMVMVGEVIDYEIGTSDEDRDLAYYALITVRTKQFLRGDASEEIEVYWQNSTFNLPDPLVVPQKVIIAAISPRNSTPPWRAFGESAHSRDQPNLPQLLQAPCSSPFILPASDENIALLLSWLEGTVQPSEGSLSWKASSFNEIPNSNSSQPLAGWKWVAVVLAAIAAFGATSFIRRRRAKGYRQASKYAWSKPY